MTWIPSVVDQMAYQIRWELFRVWTILRVRRWMIAASIFAIAFITAIDSFTMFPAYAATCRISVPFNVGGKQSLVDVCFHP